MKTKTIILLVIALLVLSACGGGKGEVQIKEFKIHTGTTALSADFRTDSPPSEITEDQPFQILIDLKNTGAEPISQGIYNIGLEPGIVELTESTNIQNFDLPGKSAFNPEGEQKLLKIFAQSKKLPAMQETYTTMLSFTACYDYTTRASATICIDSDIYKEQTTKTCTVKDINLAGGQGGPVTITKVVSKMLLHEDKTRLKPQFTITIENKGNGKVYAQGFGAEACSSSPLQQKWNRAKVTAFLSELELNCQASTQSKGEVLVDLSKGSATVRCELTQGQALSLGSYNSPLSIVVDYGYTFTEIRNIELKKNV